MVRMMQRGAKIKTNEPTRKHTSKEKLKRRR